MREGERYNHVTAATCSCARKTVTFVGVKWGCQTHMTLTVRGICTFAVFLSVSRPICRFSLVFEGHFVLCYKEKLEPLDRAMANFKRSEVCMISAVCI